MKKTFPSFASPSSRASAVIRLAPVVACCGVLGFLAGCATEPDSHLVSAPPPSTQTSLVTTTTTTSPTVATPVYVTSNQVPVGNTIIVTQAPPAPQQEVVLAQPGPQYVWLPGYWTWRNEQYQWMAGHWELPPSSRSVWTAPHWEREGNAYRFYEGSWS